MSVSSLHAMAVQSASKLYTLLHNMSAVRFAHRRLHLSVLGIVISSSCLTSQNRLSLKSCMILHRMHRAIVRPLPNPRHMIYLASLLKNRCRADSESHSRALQLIVCLGQPFHAFLIRPSTHSYNARLAPSVNELNAYLS